MKLCKACGLEKPRDEFYAHKRSADGLNWNCKPCHAAYTKQYYQKNKDSLKEYRHTYYRTFRKELRSKQSDWQKRNRQKINKRTAERRKSDPLFALSDVCRTRVKCAFKASGYRKNTKTHSLIGCEWSFLKVHIEAQFKDGMSWDNRGEWEIDHKVPVSSAASEAELLSLFHYTNLQPLWKPENRAKGSKGQVLC